MEENVHNYQEFPDFYEHFEERNFSNSPPKLIMDENFDEEEEPLEDFSGFGGGLGRFLKNPPIVNTCREIVEVPGGSEWKIRKFQEEFTEFCWKLPGSSVIVNYHFNRLQNSLNPEDVNMKMLYGKVSHFMSPIEISIQPKYLSSARKSIMSQMNAFYHYQLQKEEFQLKFNDEHVFPSVVCAVQEAGIWYRAIIKAISGNEQILVELVDFGTQILVPLTSILPLIRKFGRAPPLCLKCRVDGLTVNDLEIKDLHSFKEIISECNALFRVEIKTIEEPFLIDLYHPTIEGLNVCEKFFPPPEDVKKVERIERSWDAHCKKMNDETEDDVDFPDDRGDFFVHSKFIRRLPKCERAPRFHQDSLHVEHVENSQLIYLQYPWQRAKRTELEEELFHGWNDFQPLPEDFRISEQVVAIRNPRRGGMVRRAIIISRNTVLLVDYGRFVKCPDRADLRLMPAGGSFGDEPMVTIISLSRAANPLWPHHSETLFLRSRLKNGTKVHFKWDKRSKNTPLRGRLTIDRQYESLNDQMVKYLESRRIDGKCRQIDIYRPRENHVLPRGNHVYRSTCHQQYSKGVAEFLSF